MSTPLTNSQRQNLLALLVAGLGILCILALPLRLYIPKATGDTPWLFKILSDWAQRQSEMAWHRGGPETKPTGFLNLHKYDAEVMLSRQAADLRPLANYKLASLWLRFSLVLNNQEVGNWRIATFLAALAGDLETAKKYMSDALRNFPNHPLLILERAQTLGRHHHPRIHQMWAQEAYNSFQTMDDEKKKLISPMDQRSFFSTYLLALRRTDREFDKPHIRRLGIRLYEEMAQWDEKALTRAPTYNRMVEKERLYQEELSKNPQEGASEK